MLNKQKNNAPYDTKLAQTAMMAGQVWYGLGFLLVALLGVSAQLRAEERSVESRPAESRSVTLVELYTSQGCSSCPPADQFLQDLSDQPDVLPLSFHVDYWNSAQWRDPFSRKAFSLRQMAYQASLKTEYVYTPQMVVSGRHAVPGGQRSAVMDAIEQSPAPVTDSLAPSLRSLANDRVEIEIPASSDFASGTVYLAVYHSQQTTRIHGGENRGRTLKNTNIVKRLISLAAYSGEFQVFNFARADLDALPSDGLAVFLQSRDAGVILAAAALPGRALPSAQAQLSVPRSSALR